MAVVNLLVELEEKFSISIVNAMEFTDCLTSVSDLTEYIFMIVKN